MPPTESVFHCGVQLCGAIVWYRDEHSQTNAETGRGSSEHPSGRIFPTWAIPWKLQQTKSKDPVSRNILHVLTNFRTGHCHLEIYMERISLKQNGDCRFYGAEDESTEHLSWNCTAITEVKQKCRRRHRGRRDALSEVTPTHCIILME